MSPGKEVMELEAMSDVGAGGSSKRVGHGLWPLGEIDPKKEKFPCCIVWAPLPVVSWLVPYIGHVGICLEDGSILDFTSSNFVNVDNFAYGSAARYLQLDREQCCFPRNLASHTCEHGYRHSEHGAAISWNDALHLSMQKFQHKYYNLFTCNCHSFVANCLNKLSYNGSLGWNMMNVAALVLWKGQWVNRMSIVRAFFPFISVLCISILVVGWPFLIGWAFFSLLLLCWFLTKAYCVRNLGD